ncbi:21570_t:CDS:2 [Entrophospora sp. SA101]|nr:21570_t:CDS:2 [Entrophospora sp. SA101]CAJ0836954.1 3372_t:CDS:2 [Entrophospora sp. SA101]
MSNISQQKHCQKEFTTYFPRVIIIQQRQSKVFYKFDQLLWFKNLKNWGFEISNRLTKRKYSKSSTSTSTVIKPRIRLEEKKKKGCLRYIIQLIKEFREDLSKYKSTKTLPKRNLKNWGFEISNRLTKRKYSKSSTSTSTVIKPRIRLEEKKKKGCLRYIIQLIKEFREDLSCDRHDRVWFTYKKISELHAIRTLTLRDRLRLIKSLRKSDSRIFVLYWLDRFLEDINSRNLRLNRRTYETIILLYGHWKENIKAENIFNKLRNDKHILLKVNTYNVMLTIYAYIGNLQRINELIDEMKCNSILPNLISFNMLILANVKNNNFQEIYVILEKMLTQQIEPDIITFNIIIHGLLEKNDFKGVEICLETMVRIKVKPNVQLFGNIMKNYLRLRDIHSIKRLYKKMIDLEVQPDLEIYLILMLAYFHDGNIKQVLEMKQRLIFSKLTFLRAYNNLINAFIRIDDMNLALKTFDQIKENGLSPNLITYNTLITGFVNKNNIKEAYKYFGEMIRQGIFPNVNVFNTLLRGHLQTMGISSVEPLVTLMTNYKIAPDTFTYTILMKHIKEQGNINDFEKAINYYQRMLEKSIRPSDRTLNTLLDLIVMRDIREKKKQIFKELETLGFAMDVVTCSILMKNFVYHENMIDAEKLMKIMNDQNINPNEYIFNLLVYGYAKIKNMNMAQKIVENMIEAGFVKDIRIYTSLINGYVEIGEINKAYKEFEEMKQNILEFDNIAYTSLMNMFAVENYISNVQKIFDHMKELNIPVDKVTYTVLMKGYALLGRVKNVCSIHEEMISLGYEIDPMTISTLLIAYNHHDNDKHLKKEQY